MALLKEKIQLKLFHTNSKYQKKLIKSFKEDFTMNFLR